MKVAFIVQGEGRGHMTQAIALSEILKNNGHELAVCLLGSADGEQGVEMMSQEMDAKLVSFRSPNLIYEKSTGKLSVLKTLCKGFQYFFRYFSNLYVIHRTIAKAEVDLVINFYDLLGGIYNLLINRSSIPFICISHQYFLDHDEFEHPNGHYLDKLFLRINSAITAMYASKKLALSFRPERSTPKLEIVPPLIRNKVIQQAKHAYLGNRILAYCSQVYMVEDLIHWSQGDQMIDCFTSVGPFLTDDKKPDYITYHDIDPQYFVDHMRSCKTLFTTAGFESICEAKLMNKSIVTVPIRNHYEQLCNSIDAERVGYAVSYDHDNSDQLAISDNTEFCNWVAEAPSMYVKIIEEIVAEDLNQLNLKRIFNIALKELSLLCLLLLSPFYRKTILYYRWATMSP